VKQQIVLAMLASVTLQPQSLALVIQTGHSFASPYALVIRPFSLRESRRSVGPIPPQNMKTASDPMRSPADRS
jgi:hypothetical protein